MNSSEPSWLELPTDDVAPWTATSLQYGAGKVASKYCRLRSIPVQIRGRWIHGWNYAHAFVDPRFITGETCLDPSKEIFWMATRKEVEYLRKHGYNAEAIGLPIAYVEERNYRRQKGSLLVMPSHSLNYTRHKWRFQDYAEAISRIRDEFSTVVVCLHPSCLKNGYWVKEFQALGFPVVAGANANDRNALERVKSLMSQFEFVTTNSCGSLLVYGAAFGAKVSIYGPFSESKAEDYEDAPFYQDNPGLLEKVSPSFSENVVQREYPELFCHPAEAHERREWGLQEIGFDNRISSSDMKRCFGWARFSGWSSKPSRVCRMVASRCLPRRTKKAIKEALDHSLKDRNKEIARLNACPHHTAGEARLGGETFWYSDAATFLGSYKRIFDQQCYDFPCVKAAPTIIDCGANIGLAVRSWLKKYPQAKITAFEPDPGLFALLEKNCQHLPLSQIFLRKEAVWKESGALEFCSTGAETGHLSGLSKQSTGNSVAVRAVRLSEFLQTEVDFLKVDIEGSEVDVLVECGENLKNVKRLCVEYHSFLGREQRLDAMLNVLQRAGFRYHLVPEACSERPLFGIEARFGMDGRVNVWAYRGEQFPRTFFA